MKGKFPEGTDLESQLRDAMERLSHLGVAYPPNYLEKLLEKYDTSKKFGKREIKYANVLVRVGNPNIVKHNHYHNILASGKNGYNLLDYGCGTGDDIRRLIRDGYLKSSITGFDIEWDSIELGFDLYLDRREIKDVFVVSLEFPFKEKSFEIVHSGSILHIFKEKSGITEYLNNVYNALKKDGILFGSTIGRVDDLNLPKDLPQTLLTKDELRKFLENTGFKKINIERTEDILFKPNVVRRLWFYGIRA
jgi:SAM-dependent methyltransferase